MSNWRPIVDKPNPDKIREIIITRSIINPFNKMPYLIAQAESVFRDNEGAVKLGSGNSWDGVIAWQPMPAPADPEEVAT